VKSVKELIEYAKANPGKLTFGSAGSGSSNHLAGELLKSMAGIDMAHIPYKGSAPALTDLMGGQISMMFDVLSTAMPHIATGKTRALGVTSPQRSSIAPDIPTVAEAGLPGYEVVIWFGVLAPARTPAPVVDRISQDLAALMKMPDLKERLSQLGSEPAGTTPAEFADLMKNDTAKWSKVVKASGARVD
jgi:tripartite-type tricarboxylate transporter receptor subunit TctC